MFISVHLVSEKIVVVLIVAAIVYTANIDWVTHHSFQSYFLPRSKFGGKSICLFAERQAVVLRSRLTFAHYRVVTFL